MTEIQTKYGIIQKISQVFFYEDGITPHDILCETENVLHTRYGNLIPRYHDEEGRRKTTKCLSFHADGTLASIDLQEQTAIATPIGMIYAELLTFYPDGSLHRLFPRNGNISGFWSEQEEQNLIEPVSIPVASGNLSIKADSIIFSPHHTLQGIAFCSGEVVMLHTPLGAIRVRHGFRLYDTGAVQSLEPAEETPVRTPLGTLHAYDAAALGIYADHQSLVFDRTGKIRALITSTDLIHIQNEEKGEQIFAPYYRTNQLTEEGLEVIPLRIQFQEDGICFDHPSQYPDDPITIPYRQIGDITTQVLPPMENCSNDCSKCGKCYS